VIEPIEFEGSIEEVEALVRAAGRYVGASEGLRPRVLEGARTERAEKRVRHRVVQLMGVVIFSTIVTGVGETPRSSHGEVQSPFVGDLQSLNRRAAEMAEDGRGPGWGLVDAFVELRHEQSDRLRSSH
jgi:hypothetical protein